MLSITVFTKPACPQCTATTKRLDKLVEKGLLPSYLTQPIGPHILETAAAHSVTSAPIVEVRWDDGSTTMWGGYRPDQIDLLAGSRTGS